MIKLIGRVRKLDGGKTVRPEGDVDMDSVADEMDDIIRHGLPKGLPVGLPNLDSQPGVVLVNRYQNVSDNIGVCGLLLYHAATEDVFYAYDLACPYCYRRGTVSAIGMKDPFVARCAGCESEFGAVQYGSPAPTAGPANAENYHLRQYRARLTTYTTLVVTRK